MQRYVLNKFLGVMYLNCNNLNYFNIRLLIIIDIDITFHSISNNILFLHKQSFLLSEHIPRKESIAAVNNFNFEILTYLCIFRSPEFIYVIFTVIYVCMCVCVCVYVCTWVNKIMSKRFKQMFEECTAIFLYFIKYALNWL